MSSESETGKIRKSSEKKERAARASSKRRDGQDRAASQVRQLVCFSLDDENYGIDVHLVDEILRAGGIVENEVTSAKICGTITVRDRTVEVVDIRSCLGYPARPVESGTRVILVSNGERSRGILVDAVSEVVRINRQAKHGVAMTYGPVPGDLIREILLMDERPIAIVDWLDILDLQE